MGSIVIIGGCGHVGLPLGLAFARAGRDVLAMDLDAEKVAQTAAGEMPFADKGADELLPEVLASGKFQCTTDPEVIADAEVVVTVIGTPLDEHLNPRFDVFRDMIDAEVSSLRDGQLIVMRSTVYPGTTERVAATLEREGIEVDVAFCPERVAEGLALEEIHSLPQIVAGCTPSAQQRAEELFRLLTPDIIPMRPMAAELAKLFTNAWRYVQFATANQFYMIANQNGIDFQEVHAAMTAKYPRAANLPRAGFAAGPCLLKDTMQLAAFHGNAFFLGHAAMLINEGLPNYVVKCAGQRFELRKMTAGILGMTFKADSDDPRDSLSFKLKKILESECEQVLCSDPHLSGDWLAPLGETLKRADVLFLGVPHSEYRDMEFEQPMIDIWNATSNGISVL
jgi:UDP-N-acetyl-D-mannosaminuronic acid dehydrogenase